MSIITSLTCMEEVVIYYYFVSNMKDIDNTKTRKMLLQSKETYLDKMFPWFFG